MKKILITGASGFIGSHLSRLLLNQGFEVVGMFHHKPMRFSHNRLVMIKSDLRQKGITSYLNDFEPDCLIHSAAINPSVLNSKKDDEFTLFNQEVTMKMADQFISYANKSHSSHVAKKFINLSTYEIYGNSNDKFGHDEEALLNPMTDYARSKAETHLEIEKLNPDHACFMNVVCSNNYGPWQSAEKLIPAIFNHLIQGQAIDLYGDGTSKRTWTYVNDTCQGVLAVMLRGRKNRYHLSSMEDATVESIVNQVHSMMKEKNISVCEKPRINWCSSDLNPNFKMNAQKSCDDLKWQAKTDLTTGLSKTIDHLIGANNL